MKLFQVWDDDGEGYSLILANDKKEAGDIYEASDPESLANTNYSTDLIIDLEEAKPQIILSEYA